jgi:hypothetical protein
VLEGGEHRLVVGGHAEDPGQAVSLELPAAVLGP